MSELGDLYQEVILEHSKNPRNFHKMEGANHQAEGYNPLCGDHYTVFVEMKGDVIEDISFQGSGCAISKSSASMMSQMLKNKTAAEAEEVFEAFRGVVTGTKPVGIETLGKLAAFEGVASFPTRIKCATLAWHALHAAIEGKQVASTE